MIDEKTLAYEESRLRRLTDHYKKDQAVMENMSARIEIIRLARRYLVLRRVAVKVHLGGDWIEGDELDADADHLLEGGD
jgi:phage terminase Nu1 subunit (DNA packaging protein)